MSGSPSSPFDNIMPWKDMRRITDSSAGELVEIPKFYYKWTKDGSKLKIQISMTQHEGFLTSPAHADRGDGVGERDYIYVGRYHCADDYKSKTGYMPKTSISISTAYTGIHNLGSNIWELDFATLATIRMLCLVEYASWDLMPKIGYGYGGSSIINTGYTDNMSYHTGTTQTNRSTTGQGVQYRYIEGLWDNCNYYVNGVSTSYNNVYLCNNPSLQNSTSNYTYSRLSVPNTGTAHYTITSCNVSSVTSYEYAIIPSSTNGTSMNYMCAEIVEPGNKSSSALVVGTGIYGGDRRQNIFSWDTWMSREGDSRNYISCRLMVLPPSRLSA